MCLRHRTRCARLARMDRAEDAQSGSTGDGGHVPWPPGERLAREPRERERLDVIARRPRRCRCRRRAARAAPPRCAASDRDCAPRRRTRGTRGHPRSALRIASASERAVNAASVACTSCSRPCQRVVPSARSSHDALKRSRPVLFGGGAAKYGSASSVASSASSTMPDAAHAPSASNGDAAMARAPQVEQHVRRARCRSRAPCPRGGRSVMLAMPPRLAITRWRAGSANIAAWNAGTSGAPCPPAAMSRARKSATTVMYARSATRAGLLSCSVQPSCGPVPDRLAVHARGDHVVRLDPGREADGAQRVRVEIGEPVGGACGAHDLVVARDLQREQLALELARKIDVGGREDRALAVAEVGDAPRRCRRGWCRTSRRRRARAARSLDSPVRALRA